MFRYVLYELVNIRDQPDPDRCTVEDEAEKNEGQEWSLCGVESAVVGNVRAAGAELRRPGVPAGSVQAADGRAAPARCSDAGAVTELPAAGGNFPHQRPRRGRRAGEAPPQQKEPGWRTNTKPWATGEGHGDADDILHGPSKTPTCSHYSNV